MPDDPAPSEPPHALSYASPSIHDAPSWKTLTFSQNTFEANLAVLKLRDNNINARVDNENLSGLQHWGISGGGGTRVQVLAEDFDAAKKLLAEVDTHRQRRREATIVHCPKCGTPAKRVWHPLRKVALVSIVGPIVVGWTLLAMGVELPFPVYLLIPAGILMMVWSVIPRWRCPQCGHRWAQPEPQESPDDPEA